MASFVLRAGPAVSPAATRLPLAIVIFSGAVTDGLCMVWVGVSLKGYGKTPAAYPGEQRRVFHGEAPWRKTRGNPNTTFEKAQV